MSFLEQSSLSRVSFKKDMAYIGLLVFVVIVLMCLNFWYTVVSARNDKDYIRLAEELRILSQMISQNATSAVNGLPDAFHLLQKNRDNFESDLKFLKQGDMRLGLPPTIRAIQTNELSNVEAVWRLVKTQTDFILAQNLFLMSLKSSESPPNKITNQKQAQAQAAIQQASYDIYNSSQELLSRTTILATAYALDAERRFIGASTGYMLGATGLLLLVWFIYRIITDTREALRATAVQHKVNRAAVLLIIEELKNLASGDLRMHTTIDAEITSAIAGSVNSAIDALRRLVWTINDSAIQLSNSAQKVQSTTQYLEQASENQAGEIVGATKAVNGMASSAEQVAQHAIESNQVAQASVATAQSGVNTVHNTIMGMERIRDQIQETSKKIIKLGESTQEIGEIVSLINDIADQTNILALNASIQAASAGEAGKGFAVVAEEVQRLAERASKATRQIELIVNMIHSDTNEAVVSMEHTTQEVVSGTVLAKDAGVALEKIEQVSLNLRGLIEKISIAAKEQVMMASKISKTMDVIQEITTQTTLGTHETADSIAALTHLAIELRDSVAGFKLPAQEQHQLNVQAQSGFKGNTDSATDMVAS